MKELDDKIRSFCKDLYVVDDYKPDVIIEYIKKNVERLMLEAEDEFHGFLDWE